MGPPAPPMLQSVGGPILVTTPEDTRQVERFLTVLRNDPALLSHARTVLLTEELIDLPQRVAELTGNLEALTSTVAEMAKTFDRRLTALENDVGTLMGSDLERRARESILNIARDELDLTRGRILLARGRETAPEFLASINQAEEADRISEDQADNVWLADIIIRARRREDRQYVHSVFEVSRTIRAGDIQRAHDRAATVAAATEGATIPAVIGEIIQPQQRAQAEQMGVQVLIPAMFSRGS